jgi:MFS transporter, FHS family, glucose/mannose:H+ symporter
MSPVPRRSPRVDSCPITLMLSALRYAENSQRQSWDTVRMASPQAELRLSSSNRKLILAGQVAFFPTGILQTMLGPMLPILIVHWTMNDTQAGNLFLVQFLASLVGVQLAGVLLARVGFRPAFLSGMLLMAGGVATLYLGSPALGMASVGAYGLGLGLIVPADNLLIAEIASGSGPGSRAGAVSLLNFFWGVGAVFCSLMVGWTAIHKLLPFFLGSVGLLLTLLALWMRHLPFPAAQTRADDSPVASWRELAKSPTIWIFATIFFLYPGAETAVGGWIGSYVLRLGANGLEMAAMMPAFFWSALTIGRGLGTVFLRYVSERRVLQAGYAAGVAGIALMLLTSALAGVIAGALITGLSFATLYPITVARLSERYGVAARTIGALMFSLASIGPAVLPWMVGVISHNTGSLRTGLLVPLVATTILFLIHLFEW